MVTLKFTTSVIREYFGGLTSKSLEFVRGQMKAFEGREGKIVRVSITKNADAEWETKVAFENIILLTDGFSVGYGGEGPVGLRTVLEILDLLDKGKDPRDVHLEIGETYTWKK